MDTKTDTTEQNTIEQNKQAVTAFIDALFTRGDLAAVDTWLAEDFVNHDPPLGLGADREGMRAAGAMFREAFPDWHSELDFLVGEGDLVVERFTASGTQRGEVMGVAGDGRTVVLQGINIFRIRGGRIVERWGRLDDLGLLRQLGLVPAPTPA
ncbi:ester cyclase [Streptacidiphilus melanogenes]|uniref:ester cyclase n=1 Tax=Streptacidiphilus melanogenes TaxID=411235 RepID=UPI0005A6200A|nr:ester cyclase [Streptacidiphilus melanogenes]